MRPIALLLVPLVLAGCAASPPVETASVAPDAAEAWAEEDETRGGDWVVQVAATDDRPRSFMGSSGWPVVMLPKASRDLSIEVAWSSAAATTGHVFRLADRDGNVVFEGALETSPTLFAFEDANEEVRGERVVFVEPAGQGVAVGVEYVLTIRYLRSA